MSVYDDLRRAEPEGGAGHAREQRVVASYPLGRDIEARLARIETRLAYVDVSLHYMEVCRRYIEIRLADAAEDVAYAVGLAFEEVRRQCANDNWASSSDAGLLAQVDAALEDIGARLVEIDARLAEIRFDPAYTKAEAGLSNIVAGLADTEIGLVRIDSTLAHVDTLVWNVGAGMEAPNLLRRIPLPSVISGYVSVAGQRQG
jgi:hypothetical protein